MSAPAEADPSKMLRLVMQSLEEIRKRENEIDHGPLQRRKEICEQIFNQARDSFQNPSFRRIFDERKQLMMCSLELHVEREELIERQKETSDPERAQRLRDVERELRMLQAQMSGQIP
ncbi:MAG TPA: hypothetical protein VKA87_08685 [Nitrososphaeraceae archaeon]|nr:hypothetical protein [Nitrososphaeraceae archaeon]